MTAPTYRVRQGNAALNYYRTLREAAAYLDELTINGRPGREVGAIVEHDPDETWEWVAVPTARRHLHHRKTGWKPCHKVGCS